MLASGADVNDSSRMAQGGFRVDAETPLAGKVTVQGDYYHGTEGMPGTGDSRLAGGNLLGRWSQVLANGLDVSLQAYYDYTHLRQPFAAGAFRPAGYFTEDLGTYDLDFQQKFQHGENQALVWGLGYRSDRRPDQGCADRRLQPALAPAGPFQRFRAGPVFARAQGAADRG